jgi:autotransporter adhesin
MNKIFKIIWSKARNCYVVVSELAKSHDDGHVRRSRSGCCRKAAVLAAFVLTTSLAVVPVWAADSQGNITNNEASTMTGSNTTNQSKNSVIYGSGNAVDDSENAVVVGKDNKAKTNSVVIGNGAQSDATDQIVIGKGKANGDAVGSIVIGNSEAIANTSQSVIIGNSTKANGSGQGIVVIGNGAMANSNAAGYKDNGKYIPAGIVLGEYSYSDRRAGRTGYVPGSTNNTIPSMPSNAYTPEFWSAVWTATANPLAIGDVDDDSSGKGEAHNKMLVTRQITGVAAGSALTDAVNVAQLKEAIASVKPGGGSGTGGDGVHYYSVFSDETESGSNYDNKGATGANALAAGVSASATGAHSVAVGNGAQAVGQDSIALGTNAKAEGTGATAIGQYNTASGQNSLAFGGGYNKSQKGNTASGVSSVAFGQGTQAIAEGTLAFGENTQAGSTEKDKNNNPLGQNAVAFGNGTKATGGRSLAFGERTVASANDATAFGNESVASNMGATAFGNKNQATGQYATAWGGGDKTVGGTKIGTVASGTYATAFGERTEASGESATAFGSDSTASGKNSLAFGEKSTAAGDNSLAALGGQVTTSATNAAAIGKNAQATFADSVALGSNSVTTRAKYSDLTDEKKKAVYIKGDSTGSAWEATDNAIAVGNDSKVTRQITGVAAGSLDTDAVNVAQLKKMAAEGLDFQGNNDVTVHRDLGQKLTIQGEGKKADTNYSGENLKVIGNTDGSLTIKMDKDIKGNSVTVGEKGEPGTPGKDGVDGTIGVNGKDGSAVVINGRDGSIGLNGKDGANGLTIKGADGAVGVDGTDGHDGKDGMTRIVYEDNNKTTHEVATLDDGLKFKGDDDKVITKKLNEQLDIVGGAQGDLTDKNIAVKSTADGKLKVQMAKKLTDLTSVTTGNTTIDNSGLTIKNGDTNKNIVITDGNVTLGGNQVNNMGSGSDGTADGKPTYNTLTNGANIGDVKNIVQNTETDLKTKGLDFQGNNDVTVHRDLGQKLTIQGEGKKADTNYSGENLKVIGNTDGSLTIKMDKDIKGNSVTVGEKGEPGTPGKDGVDGTIGVNGKDGSAVVINGRDGSIGLNGKDGANGLTIKGADGAVGVDGTDGHDGKDGMTRIVYEDNNKTTHEVATLDDGLKFVGNDGKVVIRKLNTTLSIKGGITETDALKNASTKNLGVRQNSAKDGLEIVMTDTPDFTKVTVGEGTNTNSKITIGKQTVTGKKADGSDADKPQTGNYITGLDNKAWDKDNVVADRAATEGQLKDAINDISGKDKGGFGLADEKGGTVKKDLGDTVTVKGDGKNIETKVNGDALEVSLKKDVDLGKDGSIKAGETTIDKDGVKTNEIKVGDITITKDGINGGAKQITNIASGIDGKQYATVGDNNAASIGDVKKIAGEEAGKAAEAVKSKSGKNITVKDDHTVNLNDNITLGDETDASKQVSIDGNGAKVTAGDGTNQVTVDGSKGQVTIGSGDSTMTLGKQANTAGDRNPENGNYLNGLDNKKWDGEHIQSGRAATEDQLKTVSDKVNSGRVFQGDDGKEVKVGMGDTLKIQGGVKAEDVSQENNIGIVKGADDTLNIRLAKDLKGLDSVTTGNTAINNSGLTVKGDDNHKDITIHQDNVNMGGNKVSGVADGKVSKDSTDAVNGSQLWQRDQAINGLSGSVNKLGNRINRVGAGAAALAALHPLDFDPDDKWDFAAGYGNYRGANAAAIGAYYRPNEDTMFSVGGSFGGGENMVNAGVSIKLGQGNHVSTSRVAMAKEMKAMRQHMAEQDALIAKLQSMHGMAVDPAKSVLFPDVAENHWAYQYVTTLAKKGILEGYPDGEFKGDRMMTRYEFAAIVYRIVESGVGSTDPELSKLVKEFSPELQYIRIDTIQKDRNGKPTIERVRVISDAK